MKTNPRNGRSGFTLIELMAVITIIIILAGLVVGGMGFVTERQAKEKARVQLALLSKGIEEYKLDMGSYPGTTSAFGGGVATAAGGDFSKILYTALFYEGYDYSKKNSPSDWPNKATKVYVPELDPRGNKQGWVTATTGDTVTANVPIMDPWGKNYFYRTGANAQNPDFDLWSAGKDGLTRTGNSSTDLTHKDVKDDIRSN